MLSLGMIVRNEARTIEAALESVLPYVDEVIIAYAGESTDDTKKIVETIKTEVDSGQRVRFETFDFEWINDFAAARNAVLDRVTEPYFLWLDGDDVLVGGQHIRGFIESEPDVTSFYMGYDYARDDQGNNTCFLVRERIVRMDLGWRWKGAIHEVLVPQGDNSNIARLGDVWVRHEKPADKHDPRRNLDILYTQLEESEPNPDPRILAYLGSENAGQGNLTEAILHWNRFIQLSGWDEEKYQTQVKISNAWRVLGNNAKSLGAAMRAIELKPEWPDAYIALARTYTLAGKYPVAIEWLKIAASKPAPETALIVNPMEYTYDISTMIAVCYTQMGEWETALENYKNGWKIRQDPDVLITMQALQEELNNRKVVDAFLLVREHLGRHDEWLKVQKLFDSLPKILEKVPEIQEARARTAVQTAHIGNQELMLDHYRSNPHWEPMNDETIDSKDWLTYPRMAFALEVALRVNAKTIIDWGCSDGFISIPLARETGAELVGIDADPRCTDLAERRSADRGVSAHFRPGSVGEDLRDSRFDLAILFEVIEHVDDPTETLAAIEKSANHIALTTPYMAWENGNIPEWDKAEMKGHLRIFDLDEMEVLLDSRGHIYNLYREPWANHGWIFADYRPGERKSGPSVQVGAMGGAEQWGPRKFRESGLGGSETAVIRLSEELARRGANVTTFTPIDEPGIYNEVRYREQERFHPEVRSDLFIAWRWPEAADLGINTGRLVLWMHDTDAADRITPERAERFDHIVVLTQWHKQFFLDKYPFVDPNKLVVIGNGVDFERFSNPVKKKPYKVVYSSSPDRGLDIILEHIWPRVVEQVPEAELHVYYGWNTIDQFLPNYPHLQQFKAHIQQLTANNIKVVNHGRIPQERLARELQEASVWLYPTYFTETYCITAVEAQLAGAIPVTNHLAGLAETVCSGVVIDGSVYEEEVQAKYVAAVVEILKTPPKERAAYHEKVIHQAPAEGWASVAQKFMQFIQ